MTLREQAYAAFTKHLLDRRLQPGQFVTQRDLAALTGFPLGAIREMIPRLEAEGLVKTIAQRGLQVASVDPRLVRDAFHLREIIESTAIMHFVRTASDEAVRRQREALDAVSQKARASGIDAALLAEAQAVDWGFHDALVEHMGNALLDNIHRVNAIRIRMMMYDRVTLSPEALPPALGEHERILDAIEARDAARAVATLQAHLASARRRALGLDADGGATSPRDEGKA